MSADNVIGLVLAVAPDGLPAWSALAVPGEAVMTAADLAAARRARSALLAAATPLLGGYMAKVFGADGDRAPGRPGVRARSSG